MATLSTLVANISKERKIFRIVDDEPFIQCDMLFDKFSVPMVCSDFVLSKIGNKAEIVGYFKSEHIDSSLFTYFNVVDINNVSDDVPLKNSIQISAKLIKVDQLTINEKTARVSMFFIGKSFLPDGKTSLLHFSALDKAARILKEVQPGWHLTGT
jgi:hypothetical protein